MQSRNKETVSITCAHRNACACAECMCMLMLSEYGTVTLATRQTFTLQSRRREESGITNKNLLRPNCEARCTHERATGPTAFKGITRCLTAALNACSFSTCGHCRRTGSAIVIKTNSCEILSLLAHTSVAAAASQNDARVCSHTLRPRRM